MPFINGVIATAPGFSENDPPTVVDTIHGFEIVLSSIRKITKPDVQVAMVFLDDDEFNPRPVVRAALATAALSGARISNLVIHPHNKEITSHYGAEGFDFALTYSKCLRSFFENRPSVLTAHCN
jgi:hypothetical protein